MVKILLMPWDAQVCILVCVTSCAGGMLTDTDPRLRIQEMLLCIPNVMNVTDLDRRSSMGLSRIRNIKPKSMHAYG